MQGSNKYSHFDDVPVHFLPKHNTAYKILSARDIKKALTVAKNKSLTISDYVGEYNQRFLI
jgi:hypothetical protein